MSDVITNKLEAIEQDVKTMGEVSNSIVVESEEDYEKATNVLGDIKSRLKRIDALRKEFTDPLKDQVKVIDNRFKKQMEPLEVYDRAIRAKMLAYYNLKEARQQEAARLAHEEWQANEARRLEELKNNETPVQVGKVEGGEFIEQISAPPLVEATEKTMRADSASSTVVKRWDYEVVDLGLVPLEYLTVDSALIRKQISAGNREIPGLRIFQNNVLTIR